MIKKGEKTIADVRSPDYNPQLFVHTAKAVRDEKIRDGTAGAKEEAPAPVPEREDMKLVRNDTEKGDMAVTA